MDIKWILHALAILSGVIATVYCLSSIQNKIPLAICFTLITGILEGTNAYIKIHPSGQPPPVIFNIAQSKMVLSSTQIIPPNNETKIKFDKAIFDSHNEFRSEENMWQASRTSLYKVDLNLQIMKIAEEVKIIVTIQASNRSFREEFNIPSEDSEKIRLIKSVENDAYDTIKVFIKHNYKESISLVNNFKRTYLLIEETNKRIE